MPFANLPDTHKSRWGENLTAEKMKECVWLRPEAVAQIEFLEWTAADRLRHSKFVGLREDKDARSPRRLLKSSFWNGQRRTALGTQSLSDCVRTKTLAA